MRYALIPFAAFVLLAGMAGAAQNLAMDAISDVTLNAEGRAEIALTIPQRGILHADVFTLLPGGDALEFTYPPLDVTAGNAVDTMAQPLGNQIIDRGSARVLVQGSGLESQTVQLRFSMEPALDRYEPNNSFETARPVTPPFLGLTEQRAGDPDWFHVTLGSGDILGVQLRTSYDFYGPRLAFFDADQTLLYESVDNEWGHRGMRYYSGISGDIYIRVTDSNEWAPQDPDAFRLLDIETYHPEGIGNNMLVKIDMQADKATSDQMDFLGAAVGARVVGAGDAAKITEALDQTVREAPARKTPVWVWWLAGIFSLGALAGLGLFWRRRNKG